MNHFSYHAQQLRNQLGTNPDGTLYAPPIVEPAPKTERELEYEQLVFAAPAPTAAKIQNSYEQTETFDEAYQRFKTMWWFNLEAERRKKNDPDFRVDYTQEQQKVIHNMIRYFINDPSCKWPLNKGLYLFGGVGSGKSQIIYLFSAFARGTKKEFRFTRTPEIIERARNNAEFDAVQDLSYFSRCLDEVGFVDPVVAHYGNKTNVFEATIHNRYYKFQHTRQITHITSNLDPGGLGASVDERIADRLLEMCTPIKFHRESLRQ